MYTLSKTWKLFHTTPIMECNGLKFIQSQTILNLIKFIENNVNIYNIQERNYGTTFHHVSNYTNLVLSILLFFYISLVIFVII